jgi:hypothetical protein
LPDIGKPTQMWIACGTRSFTRQYGTAFAPLPAVSVDTDSMVTGGPSPTSSTEPMPVTSQVVTGDCAWATDATSAQRAAAKVDVPGRGPGRDEVVLAFVFMRVPTVPARNPRLIACGYEPTRTSLIGGLFGPDAAQD